MHPALGRFWKDDRGSLLVTEWVFVATILVLALLSAASTARQRGHHEPVQVSADWREGN